MNLYTPITETELRNELGDPSSFEETLAGLLENKIIEEHHDGGFTFNALYVGEILKNDPNNDLYELYGELELG